LIHGRYATGLSRGGIFHGMISSQKYPTFDEVCSDIGDKVVGAMLKSVLHARSDLALYRQTLPQFVADQTERGLANWIHDRMWAHLAEELSEHPEVTIVDNGVLREILCGINYRFRAKRHDEDSRVRSFPTQAALEFHAQEVAFEGLSEFKLDFGYQWDSELRGIGPAVMSLRNGSNLIWNNVIPNEGGIQAMPHVGGHAPVSGPGITVAVPGKPENQAHSK
jgi:hypothetical protein